MIIDSYLYFADNAAVTASGTSTVIDQLAAGDANEEMYVNIIVDTAFTAADGASTCTFKLMTAADAGNVGNGTQLASTIAIPQATLVAGYAVPTFRVPKGTLRYLALRYTNSSSFVAGKVTAFLSKGAERRS